MRKNLNQFWYKQNWRKIVCWFHLLFEYRMNRGQSDILKLQKKEEWIKKYVKYYDVSQCADQFVTLVKERKKETRLWWWWWWTKAHMYGMVRFVWNGYWGDELICKNLYNFIAWDVIKITNFIIEMEDFAKRWAEKRCQHTWVI